MGSSAADILKFWGAASLAALVWVITPLSWLIVFASSVRIIDTGGILWTYSVLEVIFSVYLHRLRTYVRPRLKPPRTDTDALEALLHRCLGAGCQDDGPVLAARMRRWFYHAQLSDIRQDNVREWLAWAFGGTDLDECQRDPDRRELVDRGLLMVQERLKVTFEPGYNSACRSLRLTLDPVKSLHRPLGYYFVCNAISRATILWLTQFQSFERQQHGQCEFLVSPRRREHPRRPPILFIHGLGIGIGQYIAFLLSLAKYPHGVAILLQPHISVDIFHQRFLNAPDKDEHVSAVRGCLEANRFTECTVVSHSNGTMVHGWLSRHAPKLVHRHILVDPVCFRLWEGATCFAFLGKEWSSGIEILLGYFVARELGISYNICRRFQWWDMIFWIDDLDHREGNRLHIVMGESDLLIDVDASVDYLRSHGVPSENITVCPGAQHGQALFLPSRGMAVVCKLLNLSH